MNENVGKLYYVTIGADGEVRFIPMKDWAIDKITLEPIWCPEQIAETEPTNYVHQQLALPLDGGQ